MYLTEFDEKKYEDVLREDGREEGRSEGKQVIICTLFFQKEPPVDQVA